MAEAKPLRFGAVILAAGPSTRMGSPKQLLTLGGRPLAARTAEIALESPAWPVVVVLGAEQERIRPTLARLPVLVVDNPAWSEGMASSIRAGVNALRQFSRALEGALVAVCDQPALTAASITRLAGALEEPGKTVAAARYGGRCGVPALFLSRHFAALASLSGEEGAKSILSSHPGEVAPVDLPELAADLDAPEDYAKWTAASQQGARAPRP